MVEVNVPGYPKIFALGDARISGIFNGRYTIQEKVDGSFFGFMKQDDQLFFRSRRTQLIYGSTQKMFTPVLEYLHQNIELIKEGFVYYGEVVTSPKHNSLTYGEVPPGGLVLFDMLLLDDMRFLSPINVQHGASDLGIRPVRNLFHGNTEPPPPLEELLEEPPMLGGEMVEGVVVKNYQRPMEMFGEKFPVTCGKFVSEKFKETNDKNWRPDGKNNIQDMLSGLATEPRWRKAIQRMRDEGTLQQADKDIGPLVKEIQADVLAEEGEKLKELIWAAHKKQVQQSCVRGFAQWYKEQLAEGNI